MKKLLLLGGLYSCTALLSGPERWLHPEKFIYKTGERVNIKIYEGENYEGENWSGNRSTVKDLKLYYADVTDDCQDQLSKTGKGDSLQVSFFEEGTMMFVFNTDNEQGTVQGAKTLVQVGKKQTNTFKKKTSLSIDIIPTENPYSLHDGEKLTVKLYLNKKPLANAPVDLWHRNNDQTVKRELTTNEKGEIEFPVFIYGRWMISVERTDPGYRASLTWGYIR